MTGVTFEIDSARADAILNERTALLAAPRKTINRENFHDAVAVTAGEERYAAPLSMLAGVLPMRALGALPIGDKAVLGVLYERGEVWIVYSLSAIAGGAKPDPVAGIILLLRRAELRAGLLVDAGGEITSLDRRALSPIIDQAPDISRSIAKLTTPDGMVLIDEGAFWDRLKFAQRSTL
jgi:chemotaxis signal transduction protein